MKTREADNLGRQIAELIQTGQSDLAYARLAPLLAQRIPFSILDRIGAALGTVPLPALNNYLDQIAATTTIGGWPIIGTALHSHFEHDPAAVLAQCQALVIQADVWHGVDNLGERVIGPALVSSFEPSLTLLTPWRSHPNRWVRRVIGVGVHVWAKRTKGTAKQQTQAETLLTFLEPMFEEANLDAIKGIGWGLKTLGRYYPNLISAWLNKQNQLQRRPRPLMLRKTLTYINNQ